jgi:transposase
MATRSSCRSCGPAGFGQGPVKRRQSRRWRSLLVTQRTAVHHRCCIETVVGGIARGDGTRLGTRRRGETAGRVWKMAGNPPEPIPILQPLLVVLASMIEELARLTKRLLDIVKNQKTCRVKNEKTCRQLMTIPGSSPNIFGAAATRRPRQGAELR